MRLLITILLLITAALVSACSGDSQAASSSTQAEDNQKAEITAGQALYMKNCSPCHGPTGAGLKGLGKPLAPSPFVEGQSDETLLAFLNTGRPRKDPANTTGIDMPPKGGNPALTDSQLLAIIAYIRSIEPDQE
jgi:disulfide bond formation protein DsbB